MKKSFFIKVYNKNREYLGQLPDFEFSGFTKSINGGVNECSVVAFNPNKELIKTANWFDILVKDNETPQGKVIYRGEVNKVEPEKGEANKVRITLYGIVHKLGRHYFSQYVSFDKQQQFKTCTRLKTATGDNYYYEPRIQVVNETIYYFWRYYASTNNRIYHSTTNLDGSEWTETLLRSTGEGLKTIKNLDFFVDIKNEKIYYVWREDTTGEGDYYLFTGISDLDGSNFTATQREADVSICNVNGDGTKVYIVYYTQREVDVGIYDENIKLASMNLDGSGWTTTTLSTKGIGGACDEIPFKIYNNKIYLGFSYADPKYMDGDSPAYAGRCNLDGSDWEDWELYHNSSVSCAKVDIDIFNDKIYYAIKMINDLIGAPASKSGYYIVKARTNLDGSDLLVKRIKDRDCNFYWAPNYTDGSGYGYQKNSIRLAIVNGVGQIVGQDDERIVRERFSLDNLETTKLQMIAYNSDEWGGIGTSYDRDNIYICWSVGAATQRGFFLGVMPLDFPRVTTIEYNTTGVREMLLDIIKQYNKDIANEILPMIDDPEITQSYTFQSMTYLDCINKIKELCPDGWFWYINAEGVFVFRHYLGFSGFPVAE